MTWGNSGNIVTSALDAASDNPSTARAHLKDALDELTNVINGLDTTGGAAKIDATSGKIIANTGVQSSGDLNLSPTSNKVAITNIVNLNPQTVAELNAIGTKTLGDVAFCSNGAAGADCLAFWDGSNWKRCDTLATISA
tara:strand:- start:625 stop:1041 length:417 start_codon:yes stop_codon:yes gene_type:complete